MHHPSSFRESFRVATYNVHKCRGLDGRVSPRRIAHVLSEVNADVIALQEVSSIEGAAGENDQARFIAEELGFGYVTGENRRLKGAAYGNVLLSRWPQVAWRNYDITWRGCEPRGCLRVDLQIDACRVLHVFNVHLGTNFVERRHQARRLISPDILQDAELEGGRIVLGDFNEWTNGLASRLFAMHFRSAEARQDVRRTRTYPGLLPLFCLDHIYFDTAFELEQLTLHRSRAALIASDHLPLIADLRFADAQDGC